MEITFDDVTVDIHGARLLDALQLSAGSGEVLGLIGPNGSGKSTALRCVYRALKPTSGAVLAGERDVRAVSIRQTAQQIAALTQEGSADFDFTVEEVIAFGRAPHKRGNEPLTIREQAMCAEAMRRVDVAHLAGRGILALSGGGRQRVLIARALVQQPQVLILDEPNNSMGCSFRTPRFYRRGRATSRPDTRRRARGRRSVVPCRTVPVGRGGR